MRRRYSMDKISIIIPVYNVESYITKCLESVANQTHQNLEVICINDGSTDNSGEICDEYAERDFRFKVIHKKNGGVSSAHNAGLNIFTGDYVGFVDPDDWLEIDFYERAHDLIKEKKADIVCSGLYKDTLEGSIELKNKRPIKRGLLNKEEILRYTFIRDVYPAFGAYRGNKLFSSVFFKQKDNNGYGIRAHEDLKIGEDVLFFVECVLKAKNAIYCENAFYHYFQRNTSLVHCKDIDKKIGSLIAYERVIKLLDKNNINPKINIWVKRFYAYHASLLAEIALENNDNKNLILMQNEIKRYLIEYIKTNKDYPDRIERINYLLKE